MQKIIRIGTRDSQLALFQANKVRKELEELGYQAEIVPIKSIGDIVLDKPLCSSVKFNFPLLTLLPVIKGFISENKVLNSTILLQSLTLHISLISFNSDKSELNDLKRAIVS